MKWLRWTLMISLLYGSVWQLGYAQQLAQPVTLSLQQVARFRAIVVPVKVNGVSTLAYISSVRTEPFTLFAHALPALGIHAEGKEPVSLRSVELIERTGRARPLGIATAHVVEIPDPEARTSEVMGILGGGIFAIAPVEFDFEREIVILHDRSLQEVIASNPQEWIVLPLKKLGTASGSLSNLLPLQLSDSLSVDALIAVDVWHSRIPAKLLSQANIDELGPTAIPRADLATYYLRGRIARVKLGQEVTLKNVTLDIDIGDSPPLLGASVFYALRRVLVDMRTGEIAIHRTKSDTRTPEDGYTGVWLSRDQKGRLYVSMVDSLSPAESVGIVVNDIIESIQGVAANKLTLQEAQQLVLGLVGQTIDIKVVRDGKTQKFQIAPVSWFRGELRGRDWELGFYELGESNYWLIRRLGDSARAAGLRVGDRVVKIDGADITTTLASLIWDLRGREIIVQRFGETEPKAYKIPKAFAPPPDVAGNERSP